MKSLFLFLLALVTSVYSFSQLPPASSGSVVTGSNMTVFGYASNIPRESRNKAIPYKSIEGTPYINNNSGANNNLPIGKFYTSEFEYMDTAFARYNAHTDNMEVSLMEDGVDYYVFHKQPDFLYIVLKKKTYRAYTYNNSLGFFVILSKDDRRKCTLLKKERILFKKAEKASSSFVTGSENRFQRMSDVLYFKLDTVVKEIPRKKKHFYTIFEAHKDAVKEYVESNRLKINREDDLLRIARFYNTL